MTAPSPTHSTDRERRRFEALFDTHHRALLGYALRRTGDAHDAADVVAETFLVAWRRLGDVPAGAEAAWLFGVARKVRANQRRGAQRRTDLSARLGETLRAELAAREHAPPSSPAAERLTTALGSLSPEDREILTLSAWEGLEPAEIATALGLRGSTARSRLRRARTRLQSALDQPDGAAAAGPAQATTSGSARAAATSGPAQAAAHPATADHDPASPGRADRALSLAEDHAR